ncbi:uncharacterized protein LOC105868796 isoform X2 [Microcebus murinus]|uniref:uncharacterized protein LOC105868796 isoform X2 n=1 Tax=Microcebus murinus TaxID=30608 RepID=UPI003F6BD06B
MLKKMVKIFLPEPQACTLAAVLVPKVQNENKVLYFREERKAGMGSSSLENGEHLLGGSQLLQMLKKMVKIFLPEPQACTLAAVLVPKVQNENKVLYFREERKAGMGSSSLENGEHLLGGSQLLQMLKKMVKIFLPEPQACTLAAVLVPKVQNENKVLYFREERKAGMGSSSLENGEHLLGGSQLLQMLKKMVKIFLPEPQACTLAAVLVPKVQNENKVLYFREERKAGMGSSSLENGATIECGNGSPSCSDSKEASLEMISLVIL